VKDSETPPKSTKGKQKRQSEEGGEETEKEAEPGEERAGQAEVSGEEGEKRDS
jgi:hypothetical protein